MKSFGNNSFASTDATFNHAIELFFGMNPTSPWWVLVVFYLARYRKLNIVENIAPSGYTLAHMDLAYGEVLFSNQVLLDWQRRGVHDLCLESDIVTGSVEADFIRDLVQRQLGRPVNNSAGDKVPSPMSGVILGVRRMEPMYLFEVAECFMSLSDDWYDNNFTTKFDVIIKHISDLNGRASEISYQPEEITYLVSSLVEREGCNNVFNPFAGLASYAIKTLQYASYQGQELNAFTVLIAKLRLKAYGIDEYVISCGDSITNWVGHNADCIIATPPFGMKLRGQYENTVKGSLNSYAETAESYCIDAALRSNADTAVFVVGKPFCIRNGGSDFYLRKTLCERGARLSIKYVIDLPDNLFPSTSIGTSILVLKAMPSDRLPLFIDASDCFTNDRGNKVLDVNAVLRLIDECPSDNVAEVTSETLFDSNCMFSAKHYTAEKSSPNKGEKIVRLDSLVTPERERLNAHVDGVVVDPSLFCSDWYDCLVKKNTATKVTGEKVNFVAKGPHIILSYIDDVIKIYIHESDDFVLLRSNQCALKIVDPSVSLDYAALILLKDESVQRFPLSIIGLDYQNATILCRTVKVAVLMDLKERERQMKSIKTESNSKRQAEMEAIERRLGISKLSSDIDHMLGTTKSNCMDYIADIQDMSVTDEGYEEKVNALIDCVKKTFRVIKTCGANLADSEFNRRNINIHDYLNEYSRAWKNYGTRKFSLDVEIDVDKATVIHADLTMLDIQLDTILDNARKHGFEGKEDDENNQVRIEVSGVTYKEKQFVLMRVSNNGKPMRADMTMEDFISPRRYRIDSGRLSQGGYHIYTIAKKNEGFFYLGNDSKNQMFIDILVPAVSFSDDEVIYEYDRECI